MFTKIDKEIYNTPFLIAQTESILPFIENLFNNSNFLKSVAYYCQLNFFRFLPLNNEITEATEELKTKQFIREIGKIKIHNSFTLPFKYLLSGEFFKDLFSPVNQLKKDLSFRSLFMLLSIAMLFIMLAVVKDYGVTGDEPIGKRHAESVIRYFTDGSDAKWAEYTETNMEYYGFSANVIAGIISHVTEWNVWNVRHYTNTIIGFIGLLFAGLLGLRIGGGAGGLLALLFMFLTPRYFGNSMNNLSDIPFATGYIIATYYTIRFFDFWPKVKLRYFIGVIIGIAFTISNRAPGVLLYGYFLLFAGSYYLFVISGKEFYKVAKFKNQIFKFAGSFIIIVVFSYFSSLILWPKGLEEPLTAVYDSIVTFSKFPWSLTTLFNGIQKMSKSLPVSYAPTYLLIGMPLFTIVGFVAYIVSIGKNYRPNPIMILLVFGCIFPIAYIIYQKSNIYGGMRHLTFVVIFYVVVASKGWINLIGFFKNRYKLVPIIGLVILIFLPARHMVANHPNQYIYFNELIGGMKGGYANYDLDYYYNSVKASSDWLKENEDLSDSLIVITNASYTDYFDDYPNVKMTYARYYESSREDWDYAIYSNVFIRREQLLEGTFPPAGTIHTIDVDGYPVAAIYKRLSKEDFHGYESLKKGKTKEAKQHFKNYLKLNPKSEQVLEGYANVMMRERKLDSALIYADSALVYNPDQIAAYLLKATVYNSQKKFDEALVAANNTLDLKEEFAEGQFQKGIALKNLDKPNEALKAFQKAVALKKDYYQAHIQMADILINYRNFKKALEVYNKVLEYRKDDLYAKVYSAKCYHLLNDNANANKLLSGLPERNFEVVKVKCRMAMQQNDWNNAGRYLNMARNINNNPELFVLRAQYLMQQRQVDLAKQNLDKAIELDPINREAQALQKSFTQTVQTVTSNSQKEEPKPQESIMFQDPKPKKTSPIKFPTK
ncbi:tetratricopeptide repeat protein [Draconibacterium sp. IB214405]|uniref:tetratricopeptide repeat protein n=1 Tax=Draconibacterium sp. IB214405 TaxID=3097352 RepID=UPI002A124E3B|nr:tetratricopeptide repeat protein [Draconibacterium sp. IB214405]MDX8340509.1 tetratricopeptide repeat protein [Draconibacterium sp. IB214405]